MERLRRRTDFRAAASGVRAAASGFVLQARRRIEAGPARIGFTVSKQVGNAVERNRVKRRLREMVRLAATGTMRDGHDYVLVGRRAALALPFDAMRNELATALGGIHSRELAPKRESREETATAQAGTSASRPLHEAGSRRPPRRGRKPRHA